MFSVRLLLFGILIFSNLLLSGLSQAETPVFGPLQVNGNPKPQIQNVDFNLLQTGLYRFEIVNGRPFVAKSCSGPITSILKCLLENAKALAISISTRVSSGAILVNGQKIVSPSELNLLSSQVSKTIQLSLTNSLKFELKGFTGSYLNLAVYSIGAVNQAPVAIVRADALSGYAPLLVNFDGSLSTDDSGSIANFDWSFGDGSSATGPKVNHIYSEPGVFTATLTVTDSMGLSHSTSVSISVRANTLPQPSFSLSGDQGIAPHMVFVDASLSSDLEGQVSYAWDFGDGSTASTVQAAHTFSQSGSYTVRLTVFDQQGGSAYLEKLVSVFNVALPDDPSTLAPPMKRTELSKFSESTSFLYTGVSPIQTGVAPNAIVADRQAVLRGLFLMNKARH